MPNYRTEDIRNITLVGHSGAGKTTLIEALLARAGQIGEAGTIERGTTTTDHDPLEKEFKHSLDSAVASLDFEGIHLNMIDTAGFPDFRGPTLAGMAATETTAVVINAHNGVELSTRRLMRRAKQRRLCRIIVVNKIDQVGKNTLSSLVDIIREEFGPECLPVNLPAKGFTTVADCFFGTDGETDVLSLAEAHEAIIDQVVEMDDELMMKYLDGEKLTREELHDAAERALRRGHRGRELLTVDTLRGCARRIMRGITARRPHRGAHSVRHPYRATQHLGQCARRDRARTQQHRILAQKTHNGRFDTEPAGTAVQNEIHRVTEFLAHMVGRRRRYPAVAIGRRRRDTAVELGQHGLLHQLGQLVDDEGALVRVLVERHPELAVDDHLDRHRAADRLLGGSGDGLVVGVGVQAVAVVGDREQALQGGPDVVEVDVLAVQGAS